MISHEPRRLGYYAGRNWFQSAVLFVILGLFVIGLLSALNRAKEQAERQIVDLTIRNMRTGMQLAMGEALMRQREHEMASWVGSNPVQWLATSPAGYRGECSAEESRDLSGGEWCFERSRRELVYRPRRVEHLQGGEDKSQHQCSQLSWRVARTPGNEDSGGFIGLRLEAASSCHWVVEVN
jgi:general secretion pathway protein G